MPFDNHLVSARDHNVIALPRPCESASTSISLSALAALVDMTLPADARLERVTFPVRRLKRGDMLHRAGDCFDAIYVVRSGFLKTVSIDAGGAEQVIAFPMAGEAIGLDGFDSGYYGLDLVALDMTTVVVLSFARLSELGRELPCIERLLCTVFSRELARTRRMARLLGSLSAEARVASFLLDLSERFGRLGYSRTSFELRMTRHEIGSYLGMKLETVSRTFSALAAAGLIRVNGKAIELRDSAALRCLVTPESDEARPAAGRPGGARAIDPQARLQVRQVA